VNFRLLGEPSSAEREKKRREQAFCRNISGNGICLILDRTLEKGARLDLFIHLYEKRPPMYIMGEVVRANPTKLESGEEVVETGIQFMEIRQVDQDRIVKFIFDRERRMAKLR